MSAERSAMAFPLLPILTVIFAAAKVFGFTTMSWLWVFSPLWLPILIGLGILAVVALFIFTAVALGLDTGPGARAHKSFKVTSQR